ncbi:MAG TPA: hypothetical protein VN374_00800 [Desulfitobacteriaceae bacterium]|nr:hypothetical protein [Desulfitobacteriaceae bacterium]
MGVLPVVLLCVGIGILIWGWRMPEPMEKNAKIAYLRLLRAVAKIKDHDGETKKQRRRNIPDKYIKIKELSEQGYSDQQIAQKMGISQDSVRLLALYLKEDDYEDLT